jgi:hypothetical protein
MEFSIHVKKLDIGSVLTEDVPHRKGRTRGVENGDKLIEYFVTLVEQALRKNSLDEFVVKFEINLPPPKSN